MFFFLCWGFFFSYMGSDLILWIICLDEDIEVTRWVGVEASFIADL